MRPAVERVRVHRLGQCVAVSLCAIDACGERVNLPTVYLPTDAAKALAVMLSDCAADIANVDAARAGFRTTSYPPEE